jgi:MFS family permease
MQMGGMVLASLLWPHLVRRGGFKLIMRLWAVLSGLLPLAALAAGTWMPLQVYVGLFILSGAAVSAQILTQDAVIVELSTEHNRVLYTAVIGTLNLAVILLPILLGGLIRAAGYYPVFILVAAVSAGSLLFLRRLSCPVDAEVHPGDGVVTGGSTLRGRG